MAGSDLANCRLPAHEGSNGRAPRRCSIARQMLRLLLDPGKHIAAIAANEVAGDAQRFRRFFCQGAPQLKAFPLRRRSLPRSSRSARPRAHPAASSGSPAASRAKAPLMAHDARSAQARGRFRNERQIDERGLEHRAGRGDRQVAMRWIVVPMPMASPSTPERSVSSRRQAPAGNPKPRPPCCPHGEGEEVGHVVAGEKHPSVPRNAIARMAGSVPAMVSASSSWRTSGA